jgi:hypothetical protein
MTETETETETETNTNTKTKTKETCSVHGSTVTLCIRPSSLEQPDVQSTTFSDE